MRKKNTKKGVSISSRSISIPPYEEIVRKIVGKIGKRPNLAKHLAKGSWTKQALEVLSERYLVKDKEGKVVETPEEMCWRISWEVASAEVLWGKTRVQVVSLAEEFYNLLLTHKFLPNSPTLMNAGVGNRLQYSACFVLPVEDSLVGIFDALKYQALIHQTGGGTGFSFSRLRPKGSMVRSSGGVASGPVSFMHIFDSATNEIKQGGKRRGANMGILRVDHPDVLEFIHCKEGGGIINFNISVAITDKFMQAYEKDGDYELYDPRDGRIVGKLGARNVFDEIAREAWKIGDPGLVFVDRINKGNANPIPSLGPIESTNPCGEQPLYSFDSCNLGSIFLNYFVQEKKGIKVIDWDSLRKVVRLAIRFMDNVIEVNPYPLDEIRRISLSVRRIGLGVGGWADMLIDLEIPYDSEEALALAEKLMKVVHNEAVSETEELAKERGPFPFWSESIYKNKNPRRNATVTTIAPTGSISIIAGSSSGIEPLFALAYQHIVHDKSLDRTLNFINPRFEEVVKKRGFWSEVIEKGVLGGIEEISESLKRVFVTAHEIHFDWHIKMQAAFQKWVDNAVSKTINMENGVSFEDVKAAYLLAWKTGCKGITVFRDGCKETQVLNLGVKTNESEKRKNGEAIGEEPYTWVRPVKVHGATYRLKTPVGTAFITINHDELGAPIELFINVGRAGSDVAAMAEALGRLISKALRFGDHLSTRERAVLIIEQLRGIGGSRSVGFGNEKISSLPDAVAKALSLDMGLMTDKGAVSLLASNNSKVDFTNQGKQLKLESPDILTRGQLEIFSKAKDICPSCGNATLVHEMGCKTCHGCGYSEC